MRNPIAGIAGTLAGPRLLGRDRSAENGTPKRPAGSQAYPHRDQHHQQRENARRGCGIEARAEVGSTPQAARIDAARHWHASRRAAPKWACSWGVCGPRAFTLLGNTGGQVCPFRLRQSHSSRVRDLISNRDVGGAHLFSRATPASNADVSCSVFCLLQ